MPDAFNKENFFYPIGKYRGEFTPEQLAFNANLQEFAQRVSLVCGLETNGKISADEAYHQIKRLWKDLKNSKRALLDQTRPKPPDLPPDSPPNPSNPPNNPDHPDSPHPDHPDDDSDDL